MDAFRLAHFHEILVRERARITAELARVGTAVPVGAGADFVPRLGDESDASAAGVGRDDDAAVDLQLRAQLAEIDAALNLMETAPACYGRCAACLGPIDNARLELVPTTRRCQRHAHT